MILHTFFIQTSRNEALERAISKNYIPYGKVMSMDNRYNNEACQLLKYRVIEGRNKK